MNWRDSNWRDLLSFRRMVTPLIIQALFWLGVGISVVTGLIVLFGGVIRAIVEGSVGQMLLALVSGPIVVILGVLATRIYAELLILVFRINETLTDIKDLLQRQG